MHEQPILAQIADETASRRALLKTAFGVGVTMLLTGCGAPESGPAPSQTEASGEPSAEPTAEPTHNTEHDLSGSDDEQLQLLAKREKALGHEFSELMVFLPMPTDEASAVEHAAETADRLKEFAAKGVSPYLVIEPGNDMDLHKLPAGAFATFLTRLKSHGITGEQMGTVVVCPEPNEPLWKDSVVDPELFKHNVTTLDGHIKHVFPEAKLGILLNSTTDDKDWNGDKSAAALLPYVDGLRGIDELCFQGNSWCNDTPTDPHKFLNADVAMALADRLGGPKKVALRLETGTYATQINPDDPTGATTATMNATERKEVLTGALEEVKKVVAQGYDTTLQIFGENKAEVEADWSYDRSAADTAALKGTLDAANKAGIHTTIYG
jgi:hypothetical protein